MNCIPFAISNLFISIQLFRNWESSDGSKVKSILPVIIGHEGCGVVRKIGEAVTTYKVGDHIGIPWLNSSCRQCKYCIQGNENLCGSQRNTGFSEQGCMQDFVVLDSDKCNIAKIPPSMPLTAAAPLLCAGVTVYRALKESQIKAGEFLCVMGAAGGLGHLCIQYAKVYVKDISLYY